MDNNNRQVGQLKIDTISVVERAHHHVVWSREPNYQPSHLNEFVRENRVFEYWAHAASYLPMSDFRFSLPRKKKYASGKAHWFTPTPEHKKLRKKILERITAEGPLQARHFEAAKGRKSSGWFDRKPAKQVLDQLFMEGVLMIAERRGFEKVYELTERLLPDSVDKTFPSPAEYARYLLNNALRSQGLVRVEEVAYLRGPIREAIKDECREMLKEGSLEELKVEGIDLPYYVYQGSKAGRESRAVRILSPFDNLVIQRARLKTLFQFDYNIECYVPEKKRKFGYFCLPVLEGNQFVGRIDAKAHRKEKILEIRSMHSEKKTDDLRRFEKDIMEFARFNVCEEIEWPKKPPINKSGL